jgi:hypothetical protein
MGQYGSYEKNVVDAAVGDASLATAIALEAATGAKLTKTFHEPVTVTRFGYRPTVEFDYDTQTKEGVLTIYRYPVADGTGKVALATIPLRDGALVDNVYYVDVPNPAVADVKDANGVITAPGHNKADIGAGEAVVIEVTTQAAGGGSIAGDFQPYFCFHPRAEVAANQSKMHNLTS